MKLEDIKLSYGENAFQNATIERNDKTIDYETSNNLTYIQLLSLENFMMLKLLVQSMVHQFVL